MPLTRVRYLVRHAAQHGYLVASFKVHGAVVEQAVVRAAVAARSPAIVAAVVPGSKSLLHHDIIIAGAESVTAAASVPIAIEVVSRRAQDDGVITTRADSSTFRWLPYAEYASRTPAPERADRWHETDLQDLEIWFPRPMTAAALPKAAGCRIGVAAEDCGEEIVRTAAIRKAEKNHNKGGAEDCVEEIVRLVVIRKHLENC